uniref:Zinc transporter ZIP9 n=1 Tax=Myripristis murdjan TaxID=586833 RepID=A0A667XGQ4_9TELE
MDGMSTITIIAVAMFVGCLIFGFIPLWIPLSEVKLKFVTLLGAGLLCGTALALIIPEGVHMMEESWRGEGWAGVAWGSSCTSITTTLGLQFHSAADGIALGAAMATPEKTAHVMVFFAVILHKAPTAFGLVSFLMHAGLGRKCIQVHLLCFSAVAPLFAICTYGEASGLGFSLTGLGMLFSAGTFLYVATVHVLPQPFGGNSHLPTHSGELSNTCIVNEFYK